MKTWIKRSLIGLFGVGIVVGGISACSHRYERHGMGLDAETASRYQARLIERVNDELGLNETQKQGLVALAERVREQRLALVGKTTDPRAELQALVAGSQFDRARALAIVQEKTDAVRGKSPQVIAATADFFDSLNPEQQQKLRDHLQKRRGWFGRG